MSSFGRKLARQNKRQTPEGKEQAKEDQTKRQAALQQNQSQSPVNQNSAGYTRIVRQRRSGNA
jgi:hypothetical protein